MNTQATFFYSNLNKQLVFLQFTEEPIFCEALAYLLTFKKLNNFSVIPHEHAIEISNDEINIFLVHSCIFVLVQHEQVKSLPNLHYVIFNDAIKSMRECSQIKDKLKFISPSMLVATIEALSNNTLVLAMRTFKEMDCI